MFIVLYPPTPKDVCDLKCSSITIASRLEVALNYDIRDWATRSVTLCRSRLKARKRSALNPPSLMRAVSGKSLHLKPGNKVPGIDVLPDIPPDLVGATAPKSYERQQ